MELSFSHWFPGSGLVFDYIDSRFLPSFLLCSFFYGSCLENPGHCASGACIFIPNQTVLVNLKRPVTNRGSIQLGELVATCILIALEFAQI